LKRLFLISAILLIIYSLSYAQDVKRGEVIIKDDARRVVTIDLGSKDGVKVGSAFVLYDLDDRELVCILASEVDENTFTTDLIPAGPFNDIKVGFKAEELGSGCRIEGSVLKYVPEGYFGMGDNKEDNEMPMRGTFLRDYYIDKFEVTNEEYKAFIDHSGRDVPYLDTPEAAPYNWKNGTYPEGKAKHPVVLVTQEDAIEYCKFAGKTLPTEAQWEKAARGTGSRIWPWGNVWDPKKLNSSESGIGGTRIIGSFPDDLSPFDVFDMGGNVSEWTSSEYAPYKNNYKRDENYGKGLIVIRGGSWNSEKKDARTSVRHFASPHSKSTYTGFRCVKEIK